MIARSRRFAFTAWWRTVDKLMLAALLVVMVAGIVLSLAASPPVAARLGLDPFYFVNRHVDADAAPDPAHCARRVRGQLRDGDRDLVLRRGDQGCAPLADHPGNQHS